MTDQINNEIKTFNQLLFLKKVDLPMEEIERNIETAIECMEKQIPKKPHLEADGYSDGELVYDTWICPNCETHYEVGCDEYRYCPNCGQKIDLSEVEE